MHTEEDVVEERSTQHFTNDAIDKSTRMREVDFQKSVCMDPELSCALSEGAHPPFEVILSQVML